MENLSNLGIKPHWNTENDNVIEDFILKPYQILSGTIEHPLDLDQQFSLMLQKA